MYSLSLLRLSQQFPCKNRCIRRKRRHLLLPCRQICCLDEDLGVERLLYRAQNRFVFVIAEMKLLSLPCTKVTSRLNRCWSCCAVPRRNLPREEGDELTTIRAALERASRANSEMRQSLQNNILALREYFTLNAIQGIFRSKEIFDDVCRGIGLLFEYPYFLVCCVYTGKSMVFGEVSPVQFSELMSQASPSDMQSVFHSGIEEGYSYGPAVCPRCGGQMGEKAYWDFC